ncbi:MAG: LysR substrate-binding domain-containing protein [Gammaproteobacteria bacterium]|nr:LysR substrate-binding domain-containing protein [Gammaproteobacteria bacterium]
MNLAQLRAFYAVAREGSFTTAARALSVTQPTVSSQVKTLEDSYGIRLFDRRGRRVVVTELGKTLFAITRRLYALEEEAEDVLAAARKLEHGHIKVGADGPHHIIPILAAFASRYPALEVSLAMGNADKVLHDLRHQQIDVAVLAKVDDDPQLHAILYRRSPLVLFVPRNHPWAKRTSIRLKEIADQRMILREAASVTRQIFQSALAEAGVRPQAVMQIESREAVREAVAAGLGIGVVSQAEFDYDKRLTKLRVRDARMEITEHVVCLEERRRLRIVRAFLDVAGQVAPRNVT